MKLKITEDRDSWRHQKMEGRPMLMDQQDQYCENGCNTETILYVNAIPIKNQWDRKNQPKVHMEAKKNLNSKAILSRKSTARDSIRPVSNYITEP
jgi:hypothetical protein